MVDITLHGITVEQAQRVCAALDDMKQGTRGFDMPGLRARVQYLYDRMASTPPTRTRDARLAAYKEVMVLLDDFS